MFFRFLLSKMAIERRPMKTLPLLSLILLLLACSEEEPLVISEPAGAAHYYLKNETGQDLILAFETSFGLGNQLDSGRILTTQDSLLILEDGIIGQNPLPDDSFSWIRLYTQASPSLYYALDPIANEPWLITGKEGFVDGYGLTLYTLTIPESD